MFWLGFAVMGWLVNLSVVSCLGEDGIETYRPDQDEDSTIAQLTWWGIRMVVISGLIPWATLIIGAVAGVIIFAATCVLGVLVTIATPIELVQS